MEWYHVWWPWLTSKRVARFVSDSWVSCIIPPQISLVTLNKCQECTLVHPRLCPLSQHHDDATAVIVKSINQLETKASSHQGQCTPAGCRVTRPRRVLITGRMPRSGKLPVLFLLTGQKSDFSPRRGDSLHRFRSNFARPTGTRVRLAVQNFTSIGAGGGNAAPKISKISTFPWPISKIFRGFYTTNYPTLVFQILRDSHHRLRSYCWETARR